MLFFSFFKTLVGKDVVVELKNNMQMEGQLHSVDQFLNVKIENVRVRDEARYPQLAAVKSCFVRGSVVRYVYLQRNDVDLPLLEDATRREYREARRA